MVNNIISIGNARIAFRNFEGKETKFNPSGRRNFCVMLEADIAADLKAEGWNVKWLEPRNEDEEKQAYMQVSVSYANIPPKIIVITSRGQNKLDESSVKILDWADLENVDLVIRPYNWEVNGKVGVKAYIKSMYATLAEDEFEGKYRNVPDAPDHGMPYLDEEDNS